MILIHVVLHARMGRWTLRFEFEQAKCPELHSLGSIGNIFACMHAEYRDSSSKSSGCDKLVTNSETKFLSQAISEY